ncbi:MAG: hypothetical protein ACRCTQ_04335 [Brevinemataceae bacterium]
MFKFFLESKNITLTRVMLGITTLVFAISLYINYFGAKGAFSENITSISEMSLKYPTLITPENFTFSIWGLIFLLAIAILIILGNTLLTGQDLSRSEKLFLVLFLIVSILNPLWVIVWVHEKIILSWIVMLLILLTLICASVNSQEYHLIPRLFTNVYLGWISVAFCINTAVVLISKGMSWNNQMAVWLSIIITSVVTLISCYGVCVKKNFAFATVIVWAFSGILFKLTSMPTPPKELIISLCTFNTIILLCMMSIFVRKFIKR